MGFLKGLAASVISLVLFVALSVFGVAFTLNQTLLNPSLLISEVNRLDLPALVEQTITKEIARQIPGQEALVDAVIKKTSTDLQPWAKEQAAFIINYVESYVKGQTSDFNIVVLLAPMKKSLGDNVRQEVARTPSVQIQGVPPELVAGYITDQVVEQIPASFTIDESTIGPDGMSAIRQARQYVSSIQLIMVGLVILMLVLIALLFLVNRNVKQTSRDLGVTFLMSGVIEYGLAFLGNRLAPKAIDGVGGIPNALRTWLPQVIEDWSQPVMTFGLVVAIIGAVLIIFSFIYRGKPRQNVAPAKQG